MATMLQVRDGINILMKYYSGQAAECEANHDILFAGRSLDEDAISAEDRAELDELGWHYDDNNECWARFT